jgi:ABC-type transport system involved in cytochrome bd biosynthesis fused ATPase/permease subunit
LQNKTVRDNIICSSEYDDTWYHEVVKKTALEDDMQQWAEGDQKVVGSKGVTLSGGQKRRVVRSKRPALFQRKTYFL